MEVTLDTILSDESDDWMNDAETAIPADHPIPEYWRVLVMPVRAKKMSKGGIAIPAEAQKNAEYLNYIGKIVAFGPLAYKSERFAGVERPAVGSFVIYGRYAGQPMKHRGVKFVLINDDEILARVSDPEALQIYI
jgi:chaperonin GroES